MDNQLAYIDQAAFLAMRAHGHEPVQQLVWIYDHDVNIERLREVHANLGFTLLGRRIERSPLPFGRHRWVADSRQGDLDVAAARPRSELSAWMDEQGTRGVDPEHGPAWRMAVVPFSEGGGAVSLVVSHSVADVGGILFSLFAALSGMKPELGYPAPGSRTRRQALREDLKSFRQSLPEVRKAFKAAVSVLREDPSGDAEKTGTRKSKPPKRVPETTTAIRPTVCAVVEAAEWDARAKELNGNSGSLVAAFAARLGLIMGQARSDGSIMLNFPVSERGEGDYRANALTGMSVMADPVEVITDLAPVRAGLKAGLKGVADNPHQLMAPLPLTPLTPKRVVRRLEWLVRGDGPVVGCTNMGDVPDVLTQLDGTSAQFVLARGVEWGPIGPAELDRIGDWLLLGSGRLNGKVLLFATIWQVGKSNSRESIEALMKQALADFGLSGTFV